MILKKVWKIWTRGAGTPLYLVAAATKERAWELVEEAWKKAGLKGQVGSDYYHQDKHNSVSDLEEVKGFFADEERIVNMFESSTSE